jgi:hypothetical protein
MHSALGAQLLNPMMDTPVTIMLQDNDTNRSGGLAALLPELLRDHLVKPFLTVSDALALQSTCRSLYHAIGVVPLPRPIFPYPNYEDYYPGRPKKPKMTIPFAWQNQPLCFKAWPTHGSRLEPVCRLRPALGSGGTGSSKSHILSYQLHFTWCDQGWAHREGMVYIVARVPQKDSNVRDDLYGGKIIAQSAECAPHEEKSAFVSFQPLSCESAEYYMFVNAGSGRERRQLKFREISLLTVVLDPTSGNTQRPLSWAYQTLSSSGVLSPHHPRLLVVSPESWNDEDRFMQIGWNRNRPHRGSCSGVIYPNGALAYPMTADGSGQVDVLSPTLPANLRPQGLARLLLEARSSGFTQVAPALMDALTVCGIRGTTPKLLEAIDTVVRAECEEQMCLQQEWMDRQEQRRQELIHTITNHW